MNTDILTPAENSSRGFCWMFPWGERGRKKKERDVEKLI